MLRFVSLALPLLLLMLAVFGFVADAIDLEPRQGSVLRLVLLEQPLVPGQVVLTAWLMESCGLLALYLMAQGRCGAWWLDGLVAGSLGWVFRGPVFVLTVVFATRQPQEPWWRLAFAWWILYAACGLALSILARRQGLVGRAAVRSTDASFELEPSESHSSDPSPRPEHDAYALPSRHADDEWYHEPDQEPDELRAPEMELDESDHDDRRYAETDARTH